MQVFTEAQWTFSCLCVLYVYSDASLHGSVYFCVASSASGARSLQTTYFILCCEFLSLGIFHYLRWINAQKQKRERELDLSARFALNSNGHGLRYQLDENVRSVSGLLALFWIHFIFNSTICVIYALWQNLSPSFDTRRYPILLARPRSCPQRLQDSVSQLHAYGIFVPAAMWIRLRLEARQKRNLVNTNRNAVGEDYFRFASRFWL